MQAQLKSAVMTTGVVLLTIFVMRQVAVTRGLVDKALIG
jgi:hypothetical protein